MNLRKTYWTCQVVGWGGYSAFGLWSTAVRVGWQPDVVAGYALFFVYSVGLTDLLRREILRRQWLPASLGSIATRVLPAALLVAAIQTSLVVFISVALSPGGHSFLSHPGLIGPVAGGVTTATLAWTLVYVALTASRRSREKEVHLQLAVREAELRALEAQVHPHFLFNALNSIRALVVENPAQAQDMITRLANILRYNLRGGADHTTPLASELDVVGDYLALESIRLDDRLRVRIEATDEARTAQVPPMLLQTLVENALKHGIAPAPLGGDLIVRAGVEGDRLRLEVENTGHLPPPSASGRPLGLANSRERLRILYGGSASLRLENHGGDRVVATALIPRSQ